MVRRPKVFISYSHDSPVHSERVWLLADRLRGDGVDCMIDQYHPAPVEGWPRWMDREVEEADFVLIVCTPIYYRRARGEERPGVGHGVTFESVLIVQDLYDAGMQTRGLSQSFSRTWTRSRSCALFAPTLAIGLIPRRGMTVSCVISLASPGSSSRSWDPCQYCRARTLPLLPRCSLPGALSRPGMKTDRPQERGAGGGCRRCLASLLCCSS